MVLIQVDEHFVDRDWVLKYDTPERRNIYDHLMGDNNKRFDIVEEYRIVRPSRGNRTLGHGWYKINVKIIGHPMAIVKIDKIMENVAFQPYTFYYNKLDITDLNNTLEIAKSIVKNKYEYVIDRIEINNDKKLVYMYHQNGEYVYIDADSINLDNYINYKPVFDFEISDNKLRNYVLGKFNIKTELIDNIVVVDKNFQPENIIDEMNLLLRSLLEDNIFYVENGDYIANSFDIEIIDKNVYKSDWMTRCIMLQMMRDEIPLVTLGSYGDNYNEIEEKVRELYQKLFERDLTKLYILSDGAIKLPFNNIEEVTRFIANS